MQEALDGMRYVESLLGTIDGRAASISGDKASWSNYDVMEESDLTVMGADAEGVRLRDEETGTVSTRPWRNIPPPIRIAFLEGLRNSGSAQEALWFGAYCRLLGEGPADRYFDFALELDPSPEMRAQVSAARAAK